MQSCGFKNPHPCGVDAEEWHNTRRMRAVEGSGYRKNGLTRLVHIVIVQIRSGIWRTTRKEKPAMAFHRGNGSKTTFQREAGLWKAYAYAEHLFGPGLLAFTPHLDESTLTRS